MYGCEVVVWVCDDVCQFLCRYVCGCVSEVVWSIQCLCLVVCHSVRRGGLVSVGVVTARVVAGYVSGGFHTVSRV